MKKIISVLIALIMMLSVLTVFASCGSDKAKVNGKTPAEAIIDGFADMPDNYKITGNSDTKLGFGGIVLEIPEKSTFVKLGSKYYINSSLVSTEEKFDGSSASVWYDKGIVAVLGISTAQVGAKLDFDILSMIPLLTSTIQSAAEKKGTDISESNIKKAATVILDAILGDVGFKSENGGYTVSTTVSLNEDLMRRVDEASNSLSSLLYGEKTEATTSDSEETDDSTTDYTEIANEIKKFLDINDFTFTVRFDKELKIKSYDLVASLKVKLPAEIASLIVSAAIRALKSKSQSSQPDEDDYIDYVDDDSPETLTAEEPDDAEEPADYVAFDIKFAVSYTIERTSTEEDIPDIPQKVELIDLMDIISERIGTLDINTIISIIKSITEGNLPITDLTGGNLPFALFS